MNPDKGSAAEISTTNNCPHCQNHEAQLINSTTFKIQSTSFSEFVYVPEILHTFGPENGKNIYQEKEEEGYEEVIFVYTNVTDEEELDEASMEFLFNAVLSFASTDSDDVSWDSDSELPDFEFDFDFGDFGVVMAVSSLAVAVTCWRCLLDTVIAVPRLIVRVVTRYVTLLRTTCDSGVT